MSTSNWINKTAAKTWSQNNSNFQLVLSRNITLGGPVGGGSTLRQVPVFTVLVLLLLLLLLLCRPSCRSVTGRRCGPPLSPVLFSTQLQK